jgi:cystathionine beta-lyase/cystathionine gamma-synthase
MIRCGFLSAAERKELVSLVRDGLAEHRLARRANAILLLDDGHETARRQMTGGFGGILSIRVSGGEAAAIAVAARVSLWKRATSLGGVESLIEHRVSIEGERSPVPRDLLRLSAGLEEASDLYDDLAQALHTRS